MDFDNNNDDVLIDNEEDAIDCYEGNKTPFCQYSEGLSSKRP